MRKICIITGSRAEYGLLHSLLEKIKKDKNTKLQIIATCMHLLPKFGNTYKEIIKDGFKIDYKVKMPIPSSKPESITGATGLGRIGFSKAFLKLKPDLVVVLGDRFEVLSASFAALSKNIPIAHIHGGESTFGAIDEAIRHSITKMSTWHFAASKVYKKRIIQMGENPKRVYLVGSLGVERIKKIKFLSKTILEKKIKFKFGKKNILITFHPETLSNKSKKESFKNLLYALKKVDDTSIIFTLPNADAGGDKIAKMIKAFTKLNKKKYIAFKSMGDKLYLSTMKYSDLVIGNSSSGIIEAPCFNIPTINIGDRQQGRLQAKSIINTKLNKLSISKSLKTAFLKKKKMNNIKNPYEIKNTSKKIFDILKKTKIKNLIKKKFNDIDF
jgi:GDP/UDP-N,N'-diacetylbacillosamine 2-epimerase (hydrolysing)